MRKPTFCICENKDADQLRGNREADQRLCFRYTDSTIRLLPKPEISSRSCTARFASDQVRIPEDRFSHNEAHMLLFGSLADKLQESLLMCPVLIGDHLVMQRAIINTDHCPLIP